MKEGGVTVTGHESFVYDGENLIMKFKNASSADLTAANLTTRYLHGPGIDKVLAEEATSGATSGEVRWMLTDNASSVRSGYEWQRDQYGRSFDLRGRSAI